MMACQRWHNRALNCMGNQRPSRIVWTSPSSMALYQMGLGLMVMVVVVSALGYLHPKIVHLHFCNLRCSYVQDGCKYLI